MIRVLFFGSFQHYSTYILKSLVESPEIDVIGVVTTPPKPKGKYQELAKTDVHTWAETKGIPVFTPEKLDATSLLEFKYWITSNTSEQRHSGLVQNPVSESDNLDSPNQRKDKNKVDFFVVAGYGKLLPKSWLEYPQIAPINFHFSLLPKYRGANPAEWALLYGETKSGITAIVMNEQFDKGKIIAKSSIPILPNDTKPSLYEKLYQLASDIAPETLENYLSWRRSNQPINQLTGQLEVSLPPQPQPTQSPSPYAKMLTKEASFVPWELIQQGMVGKNVPQNLRPEVFSQIPDAWPMVLERAVRALKGYPQVWTQVETKKGKKRMIIHSAHLEKNNLVLDQVQLEGQQPATFNQIKNILLQ